MKKAVGMMALGMGLGAGMVYMLEQNKNDMKQVVNSGAKKVNKAVNKASNKINSALD